MNPFHVLIVIGEYLLHLLLLAGGLLTSVFRPLMFVLYVPVYVFHWAASHWAQQTNRKLLLGVPAMVGIIAAVALSLVVTATNQSLTSDYLKEAAKAQNDQDYRLAELLLTRALRNGGSLTSEAQFAMALLLDETGQKERASELFAILAPDDRRGNREAHQRLAAILSNEISQYSTPAEIKRIFWHLTLANDKRSPQMAVAWGRYSIATGDFDSARKYFEIAVEEFPALWKALGALELQTGNREAAERSLQESSQYLAKRIGGTPKRDDIRVDYTEVLIMQGRLDEAEMILESGRLLNPDGPWPRLLAMLSISHHDSAARRKASISVRLSHLDRALGYDPNHPAALSRLMAYSKETAEGNRELKTVLARVIAMGKQPALAHVAMGNLCWLEENREQAVFHFETAIKLRDDIAVLLNNLAFVLAYEEKPDMPRALALVNAALEQSPDHPDFLDTRGTVFFLQKEWKPALIDLEKALDGVDDKQSVHRKLATIYKELHFNEISEQHRLLAEQPMRRGV